MNKVLELKSVNKKIDGRVILKEIDLHLYEGEILGLVGPNGAGKTTMIKLCTGLYTLKSGTIKLNNYDICMDYEKALKDCNVVYDKSIFYEHLSGWENIKFFSHLKGIEDEKKIIEAVKLMKLENRIHDKVKTYSFGMKKRLDIVKSLINNPKIIIMDEPFNGLDPEGIIEIRKILTRISNEGIAILISSHMLSELANICHRVVGLNNGQLIGELNINHQIVTLELEVQSPIEVVSLVNKLDMEINIQVCNNKVRLNVNKRDIPKVNHILIENNIEIINYDIVETFENKYIDMIGGYSNEVL